MSRRWPIRRRQRSARGQSLAEFALVLPLLLVLFLGIADFGRVLSAGIVVEAIARNAAEAVAGDARLVQLREPTCDSACKTVIYAQLQARAREVACDEATRLAPTTDGGGACVGRIAVGSCVRDGDASHACGFDATEVVPDGCGSVRTDPWSAAREGPGGLRADGTSTYEPLRSVEVRVCYRFEPLFHELGLPFVSYLVPEQIYLARARTFTVSLDY